MAKSYGKYLRCRVIAAVDGGMSRSAAASIIVLWHSPYGSPLNQGQGAAASSGILMVVRSV